MGRECKVRPVRGEGWILFYNAKRLWRHSVEVFFRGWAAELSESARPPLLQQHAGVLQRGVRGARSDGSPDCEMTRVAIETNRTANNNNQENHALSVERWHARSSSVDFFLSPIGSPEPPFASSRCSCLMCATVYFFLPTPSSRDQLMWRSAAGASRRKEPKCAFGNLCLASLLRTWDRPPVRKLGWKAPKVPPQVLRWPGTTHPVLPWAI